MSAVNLKDGTVELVVKPTANLKVDMSPEAVLSRQKEFENDKGVHFINHPMVEHKITLLRKKETGTKDFRMTMEEIATLLTYEATWHMQLGGVEIETPICKTYARELCGKKPVIVPILRAGLGLDRGMIDLIPSAKEGHIGIYRDEKTAKPIEYFCKLPSKVNEREVFITDPMLATGGSASHAISFLKAKGCTRINFICVVAAPEGIRYLRFHYPDINIYVGALDCGLNEDFYIVPGLGDAGDRIYGTK